MNRPRRKFQANLESLEGKALLSTIPVLSSGTYGQVLKSLDRAAGTFAKTHNANAFVGALSQISYKVPFGHSQLFPTWQTDVSIYDSTVPGSGVAMVQQLKADLKGFVSSEVAAGAISARWMGRPTLDPSPGTGTGTGLAPLMTSKTYSSVLKSIDRAAGTFAKTHNVNTFVNTLSQISYKVPFGHSQLFPTWQADVGIYDSGTPGSGVTMVQQLKTDLRDYVTSSVASSLIRFR
jgi:hypothetical protein